MFQKQAELMEQFYSGQANFDMKRAWQAKLNVEPELFKWIDIRYEADTDSSRTVPLEQLFKENGVNASTIDFDKEAIDEGIETSPSPSESSQTQDQVETMDEETRKDDQGYPRRGVAITDRKKATACPPHYFSYPARATWVILTRFTERSTYRPLAVTALPEQFA
ncbi:hypothetical protein RRG08_007635 [Elysia crispata]|uniref:Uncharacterized protein n=1 Tax=Elysia crispata TaxID=231223 RepID=A0AAE0Y4Q1_9GAST|nr:hypothetical protein RRG08_007635 [Elysia crispata]